MKPSLCKTAGCERKRFQLRTLCLFHIRERERAKKAEKAEKKKLRRLNSKGYQESQKKILIKKCDAVFSQLIRSAGVCLWCGKRPPEVILNNSHIFSRRHMAIRWEERNAKCLCVACHRGRWHAHPAEAAFFLSTIRTPEEIKWLKEQTNVIKQWTEQELRDLLANLSDKLSRLTSNQ